MPRIPVDDATLAWLLSEDNPPVRYLTLTRLLDRPEEAAEVRAAREHLGDYAPTRKILARRHEFWRKGASLYQKYRGGYWQLLFLGEMLAPPDLPGVAEGVEFVLESGRPFLAGEPWFGIHCLNANLLRAMVALGHGADPRVRAGLEHLAGAVLEARGVPCFIIDWSIYPTCRMSLPKVLLALTALPPPQRTPQLRKAARLCRDLLLEQDVCRYVSPHRSEFTAHLAALPPGSPRSVSRLPAKRAAIRRIKGEFVRRRGGLGELEDKPGWLRFGFPLHYNSDALEALLALVQAETPRRSPGVRRALATVVRRRQHDGRWKLDFSHNGKMIADVEKKGRSSRWITYRALHVLKHFAGLELDTAALDTGPAVPGGAGNPPSRRLRSCGA